MYYKGNIHSESDLFNLINSETYQFIIYIYFASNGVIAECNSIGFNGIK